jgi:protocatechuate 3,4-dioxygenase beta subunit
MDDAPFTRGAWLARAGAFAASIFGAELWWRPAFAPGASVSCVLTPEQTEGPYYIPNERIRRNITEGHPGAPLDLRTVVVDASTCKPIRNAAVDIWHADAAGVYSGFGTGSGNRSFMRGVQRTDAKGLARFRSVYPGWYQGRTLHIHVKVHAGGRVVHTGQLYFPDALTDAVYRRAPYVARPNRDVRNVDDAIFRGGGQRSLLRVRRSATGVYVASIVMGVRRK